ncbi:hypothetical protein DL98DRAFT_656672 [Cadophora sp. DSE1049]|nr:hypothetical protein DL98DRAFT_656672 [Cadophora sp. DSE1049]
MFSDEKNEITADYPNDLESDLAYAEYMRTTGQDFNAVIQERGEVIQYAKAVQYMLSNLAQENPTTESVIKECPRLLIDDETHTDIPVGDYREYPIAARNAPKKPTKFVHHSAVPAYMFRLVLDLHNDLAEAEISCLVDPFTRAARYCTQSINIHPFGDGNGRLSRIILNAILLKYLGIGYILKKKMRPRGKGI